jgi:hypothetical protein
MLAASFLAPARVSAAGVHCVSRDYCRCVAAGDKSTTTARAGVSHRLADELSCRRSGSTGPRRVFAQGLAELGWTIGRNVRIEYRWSSGDADPNHRFAAELIAVMPNVVPAASTLSAASLQRASRAVPIVFVNVTDPVGAGLVDSLARPGSNTTGFMLFEYNASGKCLELLKVLAPRVARAAVLWDNDNPAGRALFGAIQAMASSIGLEVTPVDASEIERGIASFGEVANGGLIVNLIIARGAVQAACDLRSPLEDNRRRTNLLLP